MATGTRKSTPLCYDGEVEGQHRARSEVRLEIVVYGSKKADCRRCREAETMVQEVLEELGARERVSFRRLGLQDPEAAVHGVMVTPTIVIDDQIVADGELPDRGELQEFVAGKL